MLQTHRVVIFLSSHTWSDANLCQAGKQRNQVLWERVLTAWLGSAAGALGQMALLPQDLSGSC